MMREKEYKMMRRERERERGDIASSFETEIYLRMEERV